MRRIEQQDADQQHLHAQAIPKRGTGLKPVENMAKMAMPLDQAYPSQRDEAVTQSTQAIPKACGFEAATQIAEKKTDLKKQSQFVPALMGVTSFVKRSCGSKPAAGAGENKANQSQFPASELPKGAGKREKSIAARTG